MLSNKSKAIGYIMLSAFGFALMTAFVRLAGDLPFTQKSLFRNLVAVAVAVIVLRREKCGFKWEKGNLPLLILRSTCGTLGIFCNYYAIDHLVLADANILNKMSPFFAILFSLVLLKERANVWQYLSVLAAFGGAMLIIKPGFSADTFPAVIGLLGGMSAPRDVFVEDWLRYSNDCTATGKGGGSSENQFHQIHGGTSSGSSRSC